MSILKHLLAMKASTPAPSVGVGGDAPKPFRRRKVAVEPATKEWPSDAIKEGDGFVSAVVRVMDSTPEASRAGSAVIHVSALVNGDFCPRAHLIHERYAQGQSASVLPQMRIVWALGRAAEMHVRNQFIAAHGRHRVIGKWRCRCGESEATGEGTHSSLCQTCGGPLDIYGELDLYDPALNVGGHPDLVFLTRSCDLEVVEIKSIKKDAYEALTKAVPEHVLQCRSYCRMLGKSLPGRTIRGRVFYVAKDFVRPGLPPYREFPIGPAQAEQADMVLDALATDAEEVKIHSAAGTLPPRLSLCSDLGAPRAKKCTACGLCFGLPE